MKKLIFFSCCILFVTFLGAEKRMIKDHEFSIALTRNETDYVILVFDFGHFQAEPVTIAGKTYYSLNLEKESNIQERGYPELPTINRSLIIPDASGVAIEILDSESVDYSLPVAPSKGEILRSQDPATVPYSFAGIYQEDAFFPESTAKLGDPYILRDFRGILLTVFPFAYNPRSGTLRIYHHLEVKVTFQGRSETNIKDRPRNGYSADFECVYRNHFLNFDPSRYTQVDETGRLIVICHGDFLDEIQPYVDWKLQKGIQTDLYDVASIGATAELIKAFIEDEYDSAEGLTFVQLVGDAAQIPTFLSGIHGLDPVYAEVEGSDSYPDLFVGRFSGTETAHIATQVERTLYYERDIDPGNWMHYALGVASNQGPGDDGEFDWQHLDNIRDDLLAYNYTYVGQVYDPGATDTEVANELNAGRGFVNYTGHGSIYSWSTSGFNTTDINNLTNSFTLPFICDVACYNGDFVNYSCFGEIWLRATHNTFGFPTGAIAIYASSISQPWNPPMAAQDEVTDLLVAEEMNTVGGLFFNGSCQMMDDYPSSDYVFEAWNIFGDVSLMVRTDTPAELLVTHSSIIDGNDTVFFVSTGFSGALVCLTDADNQIIDSGYTNVLGWIYLDLPARSGYEEYNLTVTAYNYDTYQATITVYDGNAWLGEFNYYWHNDANWSYGHIPTVSEKVLITTQGYHPPKVDLFDETCADLDILPGATLQIWDQSLTVDGDLDIEGTLAMQDAASYLLVYGDVFWQPGSEATILADNTITVQGNWNFQNGCGVHLENGSVNMNGPLNSWIRFYDADSYFNDLKISKNSGYYAKFSNLSTCNPQVQGNLLNYTGSVTGAPASFIRTIYLGGYFYNEDGASFQFDNGDFVFTGNNPYLGLYTDDDYFNNLTLSCTGTTYIWDDLHVKGNLTITSGQLDMVSDSSVIEVGGNWDNQVGPAAFLEGANKVRFNGGNYHQYCSNEDFYRLEVAKTSGGAFRINGTDVTCGHYLYSGGAVDVLSGSFTASDLDQNGIYGAFYLNPGGIINLSNYDGYVDINGQLHIFGGTMNVYGNMGGSSMWGYGNSASLEMSGGVLDFKEIGISQSSANEVVENISAGTIRTAGSFTANYWDFSPSGGMVELYGPNNSNVGLMTGNYFNKLTINKAATDIPLIAGSASDTLNNYSMNMWNNLPRREMVKETKIGQHNIKEIIETQPPVPGKDRDGNQVLITRENTVLVTTDLVINSILEISNGIFDLNNHTVDANSRVDIHGILKMNTSNCILYAGSGTSHDIGWYSGSSANITAGTIYPSYSMTFFDGTNVLMGAGSLIYFSSDTYESGFWCYDADAQAGSVVFNKSSGNGYIAAGSTQPLRLSGDLDILNSNHFHLQSYDMFMEGTINITTGSLVDMGAVAEMEVDNDLILEGDLNIGAGTVIVHGIPTFSSSGSLNIAGGSFVCDTPDTGRNYIYINSDMDMTDGLFELTHNSIYFRINPKNVSGGTIRTGESFCANGAGIFQPSGGTVEITGSGNFASYLYSNNFFHDLLINRDPECGTGMYTDFTVKNDLAIQSGRLYNSSSYDLYLGGDWINNVGIDGFQEGTGTVIFTGPGESAIFSNETFYDLTVVDAIPGDFYTPEIQGGLNISVLHDLEIINGCIALLDNAVITVDGNINIHTGAGLNTTYGARVEFAGNWNDANTAVTGWQSYTAGNNSIFNAFGTSDQNISTSCPQLEVYQLLISKTGGNFIPAAAFKINGNLNFLSGYWIDSLTGLTHSLYGDFYTGSSAAWNSSDNTVRFTGPMEQSLEYYGSSGHLVNIIIDKAMPRQPENLLNSTGERDQDVIMYSDIPAQNGLISIQAGILNLNGNTLTQSGGNIVIGSSGTLIADAGAVIKLGAADELLVNAGGRLEVVGNATNPATVTRYGSGDYYTLEINALGTIAAKHAIFKYLGSNGITINDLAVVDPIYKFDFCSFSNGDPATGSCLLYFLDSADLEIQSASFPTINPGCYNVRKTLNAGDITFIDATGDFAGEDYENDPYGRIHWENSVLPAIENLTIIYNSSENCIELSWIYSAEYDSFRIYRGNYPDFIPEPGLLIGSTTSSSYTDYDLSPEKSFYRIIVVKN